MTIRAILAVVACIAFVIGIVLWIESTLPNSTRGVELVADYDVRLPVGETLILVHRAGKVIHTYEITYDGKTVRFHCDDWFCSDLTPAILSNDGGTIDVDVSWPSDPLHVSRRPDGTASVVWPGGFLSGWEYRPYQS